MSGPTIVTHDNLVDIWNVKIGRNDAYGPQFDVRNGQDELTALAQDLETKIVKTVLGEGAAATSITDFKTTYATDLATNTNTHKLGGSATPANGMLAGVQVTQHFKYRNAVLVADYLDNADANATNEAARGYVAINSTYSALMKQTKILEESSAFENATVRLTVTDPYEAEGAPTFQDESGTFTGQFNRTGAEQLTKYRYTRNVNANCANDDGTPSISVTEHTAWNTANYGVEGAGPAFVNGSVTLDGTTGAPVATLYGDSSANNILSSSFNSTGENANEKGFDISYNYVSGQEPIVGRYSLSWAGGTSGDNANPITIETNNMTDLVVVADKNDYNAFLSDTTTPVTLVQLPTDLTAGSVVGYLIDNNSASLNPGFNFVVTANAAVTGEVNVTTTDGILSPIAIDASEMDFALKNKYYLEQSVPSTVLPTDSSANLLTTTTIEGGVVDGEQIPDVDVTNSLTITNGSLALTGTHAAQFEIVDGTESLGAGDYDTNGLINFSVSVPASSYREDDASFPRAVGGSDDFASTCFVHYLTSEDGYNASYNVLATADKSIDVSYNITTLASQTSIDGPTVANKIGRASYAVAFISTGVDASGVNSAINASDITFSANTNTYTDGELTIVDLKCQKKWSDNGIVDHTNTPITGAAVDVVAINMSTVGVADIKDLRIQALAKQVGGLSTNLRDSFGAAGWSLSHANSDTALKSSLTNQGVISDAKIITIMGAANTVERDITLNFGPAVASVPAKEFTKFHNRLDITYDGETQTTYDDEFTYVTNTRGAISEEGLTSSNYAGIPAGKALVKRSYIESVRVKTAFRFGNYSNLDLTTTLFSQTTTYYVLKDGSRDLPRQLLDGITLVGGAPLLATIETKVGVLAATPLVAKFVRDDLKPYLATMLKETAGAEVYDTTADVDVWYNTPTTIIQPNVGTFTLNLTLSPSVSVMDYPNFTVDLALANGADTFTFTGKTFSAAQVDALTTKDVAAINLDTAAGTPVSGTTNYTHGAEPSDPHTLAGGGYTFTMIDNIYVDIRVVACPNGLFKVVKNGATTYASISNLSSTPYLKLDSGVRVQGSLDNANHGEATTWTLTNDAIRVNHWAAQGVTEYARIPSLNYVYRHAAGWKGVSNKWLRGFDLTTEVVIERTPSTFVFDIAGYTYTDDLYTGLLYQDAVIGNLSLSAAEDAKTMFSSTEFNSPKTFPLRIKYGSYRITDITGTGVEPLPPLDVPAYKTVISFRKGVRIISKSLNTRANAQYSILYSVSDTLNVRRLADYTSTSTTLSDFTGGQVAGAFTMTALKTGASNLIGNVLNIRYLGNGDIPDLTCFFTIAPAFLKFQAVDHTTTGDNAIASIPFVKQEDQLLTRYKAVSHSSYTAGAAVPQSWTPFSGSDVNNMTISSTAKTFEQYRTSVGATHALDVDPHNLKIEYASGFGDLVGVGANNIGDFSDAVFDDIIPLTDFSNDDVKLESDFDGQGTLKISLNQKNITTNGAMPAVIFDEADRYNLVIELGSHLLTPTAGSFLTDLEFSAGDCTGLTTYCIDSIYTTATDFKVKIARYSSTSGVNSDLFNESINKGIAVGGSVKKTIELSTPLSEEPGDMLTVGELLTNIKANMDAVVYGSWATVSDYDLNSKMLWLKPTSAVGKTDLRTALLLSTYVPRSVTVFELDDAHRLMDKQGVAVLRVASQGKVYRNITTPTSPHSDLLHLANAVML